MLSIVQAWPVANTVPTVTTPTSLRVSHTLAGSLSFLSFLSVASPRRDAPGWGHASQHTLVLLFATRQSKDGDKWIDPLWRAGDASGSSAQCRLNRLTLPVTVVLR